MKEGSISSKIIKRIAVFLIFLILLAVANYLTGKWQNSDFISIIGFFNENIGILLLMTSIFIVADIFWSLRAPFNIPAPLMNAMGGVLIVSFVSNFFYLIESIGAISVYSMIEPYFAMIYGVVFWLVLIIGYIMILYELNEKNKEIGSAEKKEDDKKAKKIKDKESEELVDWSEVGNEFRLALRDFARSIRGLFGGKKD